MRTSDTNEHFHFCAFIRHADLSPSKDKRKEIHMGNKTQYVKLNRSDFLLLFSNDVVPMNQVVTIRFKTKQNIDEVRNAARYMLSMYPRLRGIIVPTLFSYRLQILDDHDPRMNIFFHNAFHVQHSLKFGTEEFDRYRRDILNEPSLLENRLGIKFHFLPDDPNPDLIVSLNHIIGDGMSQVTIINSLLAYLNGKRPASLPLEDPSMKPVLFDNNSLKIPLQLFKSYMIQRKETKKNKEDKIIEMTKSPADFFTTVNAYNMPFRFGIKPIQSKAKELGFNVFILTSAALALSFFRHTNEDRGDTVGITTSFDLRPYFNEPRPVIGNYLRATILRARRKYSDKPLELMKDLQAQMDVYRARLENKEILFSWMMEEMQKFAGRKICAQFLRGAKRNKLFRVTCQFTTIGKLDFLNAHGESAQLCGYVPATAHFGLFLGMSPLEGAIQSFCGCQESDYSPEEIKAIYANFEDELQRLMDLKP
jgi:NRPS condensation-like uncharacterized protein